MNGVNSELIAKPADRLGRDAGMLLCWGMMLSQEACGRGRSRRKGRGKKEGRKGIGMKRRGKDGDWNESEGERGREWDRKESKMEGAGKKIEKQQGGKKGDRNEAKREGAKGEERGLE